MARAGLIRQGRVSASTGAQRRLDKERGFFSSLLFYSIPGGQKCAQKIAANLNC